MRFRILGPLEADVAGEPLALGGVKQRATLGFLLLHADRVVSASQLVRALWPADSAPVSARKILHNAVWGLRRVLASPHGDSPVRLSTQAPGYLLRVDPDCVDLYRFRRLAEAGRVARAAGDPNTAATLLREALSLWRGAALADLVETGIAWPELASAQNARLDTVEDYFDAELACGNHLAVLGELEMMAEAGTLRERSCGQLMLALYRCGRQADALNVYRRLRTTLIDELGLEPGRELQTLQHAILMHDPSLAAPSEPGQIKPRERASEERAPAPTPAEPYRTACPDPTRVTSPQPFLAHRDDRTERSGPQRPDWDDAVWRDRPAVRLAAVGQHGAGRSRPSPGQAGAPERHRVSLLIVRAVPAGPLDVFDESGTDEIREHVSTTVRAMVQCFGGTVAAAIGSVSLAAFGAPHEADDDAERAVHAAVAIRDELGEVPALALAAAGVSMGAPRMPMAATPGMSIVSAAPQSVTVHAAVVTGDALVRPPRPDRSDAPMVHGALLDQCQTLLARVPAGEVRVCDVTRLAAGSAAQYAQPDDGGPGWLVVAQRPGEALPADRIVLSPFSEALGWAVGM